MSRIAFIHGSNDLYGASRVLLQDVELLRASGWAVDVVLPEDGPLTERLQAVGASVAIERLHVLRRVSGATGNRVPLSLPARVERADVVVLWTMALASYLPALRARRKLVLTSVHEILEGRAGSILARATTSLSHGLMINSRSTGEWLAGHGALPSRTHLAYPVAPAYDPLPPTTHAYPRVDLLLAGRINGHKGQLEAVAASRLARERGLDVHLTLVGGSYPGQEHHLEELLAEIGDADWVTYAGETGDIRPFFAQVDAMIVPTTKPEPFGVVALEAWAAGRRVIASDEGGLAEATELVNGISFPPRNIEALAAAITCVAGDRRLRSTPLASAPAATDCTLEARGAAWSRALAQLGNPLLTYAEPHTTGITKPTRIEANPLAH